MAADGGMESLTSSEQLLCLKLCYIYCLSQYVNASGDASYLSILVGKDNYYMPYDVAVQACNEKGEGPISPQVTLRSAMRSKYF